MAAITSNTESWNGHSFSEVETHVKDRFNNNNSDFIDYNGHAYVEIGGIKWATMNIGANSVTDYGQYFQWGDTTGYVAANVGPNTESNKKPFSWADYKFSGGRTSPGTTGLTKYNSADTKTVLDLSDDVAHANWGGSWRMPITAEFQALGNAVTRAWKTNYQGSGVAGLVCTDKTDSSKVLFFPAAGYCNGGSVKNVGTNGRYWSSSFHSYDAQKAYYFYFNNISVNWGNSFYRNYGLLVRPVIDCHKYVDLGLPSGTKWATMNVGASSETDYGNYYQYGKGAAQYAATSGQSDYSGTEDPLASSADTAAQVWGGSWHMPTRAQMEELTANTTYEWVTNYKGSGINGGTFTATNGAVLFLPAAGYWSNGSQFSVGSRGYYWGSSPDGSSNACSLYFVNGYKDMPDNAYESGFSVRPVIG